MKTKMLKNDLFGPLALGLLVSFASCTKSLPVVQSNSFRTSASIALVPGTTSIAIAKLTRASASTSLTKADSLYLVHAYAKESKVDSVLFSALPASIGTYLTANYAGYTFLKAFKEIEKQNTVEEYIVLIKLNGNIIGLKFNGAGVFHEILEQREGKDVDNEQGYHEGGMFQDRDGKNRDTIGLRALPSAVKLVFTTKYPTDTLLKASYHSDSVYTLISKNKFLFVTLINSKGVILNHVQVNSHQEEKSMVVVKADLLPAIATYLSATYPGYVFNMAFSEVSGGMKKEYEVFITVNTTKYVLEFDAQGAFTKSHTLR